MNCPSCGWEQEEGPECVACGVVFAKLRTRAPAPGYAEAKTPEPESSPPPARDPDDPWPSEPAFAAKSAGGPKGDLYDPDAALPAAIAGRHGRIRAIRVMPRIGVLDTILQAVEAIFRRPFWFGFLLILQWGLAWIGSLAATLAELFAFAGLGLFMIGVVAAAAMVGFRAADRGLPLGVADVQMALARAPRYLLTVCVLALLVAIAVAGPVAASFFLLGPVAGTLAGIAWVVVAIVAATAIWGVAGPASVDERIGPLRALGRSRRLTDGSRLAIVGSQVLLGLAGWLLQSLPGQGPLAHVGRVALAFHSVVGTTWWAVLYYRLRSLDEGVPMDELDSSLDPAFAVEPERGVPA